MWPSGYTLRTQTRSPGLNLALNSLAATLFDLFHLAAEFFRGDDAALDHGLGDRAPPAFVIAHAVIGVGAEGLDILAQLVHGHELFAALDAGEQRHQRINAPLPFGIVMLGGLYPARGQAAHVVMAAFDHGGYISAIEGLNAWASPQRSCRPRAA